MNSRWSLPSLALELANEGHDGQMDKSGLPILFHVLRVGLKLTDYGEEMVAVGFLHDLIEDTPYPLDGLRGSFPEAVVEAVDAMTRRENEPYESYIDRVLLNGIAIHVKISDVTDNMNPSRAFPGWESLLERYVKTLDRLIASPVAPQGYDRLSRLGVTTSDYQMSQVRSTANAKR